MFFWSSPLWMKKVETLNRCLVFSTDLPPLPLPTSCTTDTEGMLTMVERQPELICLELMFCLFLNTDLMVGFADFSSPAASVGLSSGTGLWISFLFPLVFFWFFFKCVYACALAILLEYSEECWGEALTIWSLLPALHNKNRHTSTPVMDDKETGT